jgi:uncharacterized protein YndB with AHSA1/START domain
MSGNAKVLARVVHHFTASAERVFDAWLDPAVASRWWFTTPGSESNNTTIDGRIGGHYRIIDRRDGTDYTAIGEFLEIRRPHRLVFTFKMPQFSEDTAVVTVDIERDGTGCILTLVQECPPAFKEGLEHGWREMLDVLTKVLPK